MFHSDSSFCARECWPSAPRAAFEPESSRQTETSAEGVAYSCSGGWRKEYTRRATADGSRRTLPARVPSEAEGGRPVLRDCGTAHNNGKTQRTATGLGAASSTLASRKNFAASSGGVGLM